eukprot:9195255-Alexandrium_andersonii.AAC.1
MRFPHHRGCQTSPGPENASPEPGDVMGPGGLTLGAGMRPHGAKPMRKSVSPSLVNRGRFALPGLMRPGKANLRFQTRTGAKA